ncbi:hypothetical protein PRK78_004324 [Emydomyces testavorans]|uniref:SAP domain-containing protein n=1 Tax=Emydomyces testavorans TaxID=2070801 RepID=A0AAF0IJN2_9EURO|nr:hypothetical protein PRK78_004324 [Emydomyces testavorans]
MATVYSKKTNSDLIEMLKARGLPHTGKKADMVARLVEADKATAENAAVATTAPAPAPAKADTADDVIDWDDDATPLEPAPAAASITPATGGTAANGAKTAAAGGKGAVANPTAVPNQKVDIDPSTTHDLTVKKPGDGKNGEKKVSTAESVADKKETDERAGGKGEKAEIKAAENYSMGLATTDLDAELEKRRKRAEKFGIADDPDSKEAQKAMERAKRFGTANNSSSVQGLDEALPERGRKRGRGDDGDNYQRGGKRRNFSGRGRGRGGFNNRRRGRNDGGSSHNRAENWSEHDRTAMEKRKTRFG